MYLHSIYTALAGVLLYRNFLSVYVKAKVMYYVRHRHVDPEGITRSP